MLDPGIIAAKTLQEYFNSQELTPGDMILGDVFLDIPPQQINVNEAYHVSDFGGAIRQRGNMKFNKGRSNRSISLSLYFIDSGKNELDQIIRVVNLFKYSPFVAVYNEYLNVVWNLDALALIDMTIMSDQDVPGSYNVVIQAEEFNYRSYVPYAKSFASIIDYNKYSAFLKRGLVGTEREMSSQGANYPSDYIHSGTDIDFLIHDLVPTTLKGGFQSWDVLYDDATYSAFTIGELKAKYGDDVVTDYGFSISPGGNGVTSGTPIWDPTIVSSMLDDLSVSVGSLNVNELKDQIRAVSPDMTEDEINFVVLRAILQKLDITFKDSQSKNLPINETYDINHDGNTGPGDTWIEEWAVPMIGMNFTDDVSLNSMAINIHNTFARLPILSQPIPVHQYLGGGALTLEINLEVLGEKEIQRFKWMFDRCQEVARLTRAIGTMGFLGIRSDITKIAGCKYFMPHTLNVASVPELPHVYGVSITLSDFDIYQQEKETWTKNLFVDNMMGNPFMRLKQFGHYFQLFPDMPLEFSQETGWEAPDFYFITESTMSSALSSNSGYEATYMASVGTTTAGGAGTFGYSTKYTPESGMSINYGSGDMSFSPFLDQSASQRDKTKGPDDTDMHKALISSFDNLQRTDIQGTMAGAFPTYCLLLVDEPRNMFLWKTFGDFYGRQSVMDIKVHTNQNPMFDTCQIQMTDMYKKSTTATHERNRLDVGTIVSAMDSFWDKMLLITGNGPTTLTHIAIEPGMRIHLRMGYSADLNDLDIVFNGTITEVMPDNGRLEIVAQGDGRELLGILKPGDKKADSADISGLFYSEPRDLLIKLLTMRGSAARDVLALATKGMIHPSPRGGIKHFGMLLANTNGMTSVIDKQMDQAINDIVDLMIPAGMDMVIEGAEEIAFFPIETLAPGPSGAKAVGTQLKNDLFYNEGSNYKANIFGYPSSNFKDILKQSLKNIYLGWDTEIFKRNIYAGNGFGLLEPGSQQTTGAFGDIGQSIVDTLDFMSPLDEPSFKVFIGNRTIWDIMRSTCDIVPNYVLGVRNFEHRSTLFFGKPYWQYTSGVTPATEFSTDTFKAGQLISDFIVSQYMPSGTAARTTEQIEISTTAMEDGVLSDIAQFNAANNFMNGPGGPGGGIVDGNWLDNNILKGTGFAGYGGLISTLAYKYNVPWELAMAMFRKEASFLSAGSSVANKNPGNLRWSSWETEFGGIQQTNFTKFPSIEAGTEAYFHLLDANYRSFINSKDWSGLVNKYAPPSQNNSTLYTNEIIQWMNEYRSKAEAAGAVKQPGPPTALPGNAYDAAGNLVPAPLPLDPWAQRAIDNKPPDLGIGVTPINGGVSKISETIITAWKNSTDNAGFNDTISENAYKNLFNEGNGAVQTGWEGFISKLLPDKPIDIGGLGSKLWYTEETNTAIQHLGRISTVELTNSERAWVDSLYSNNFVPWMKSTDGQKVLNTYITTNRITDSSNIDRHITNIFTQWIIDGSKNGLFSISPVLTTDAKGITTVTVDTVSPTLDSISEATSAGKFDSVGTADHNQGVIQASIDSIKDTLSGVWDKIKSLIGFVKSGLKLAEAFISLAFNFLPNSFRLLSLQMKMDKFSKEMNKTLLDSKYYDTPEDNPFTREFMEPVTEIREPFARLHYTTSFSDMINWNISADASEVYPVIHAVSSGKKPKTVYADKSISSEFQKEKTIETYLNWDILNFNEEVYAKRMGLAECARTLKTMYQGNMSILGNSRIRPFDNLYVANAYDDYWGLTEVHSVTHIMNSSMGWTTSMELNPIVIVDDPGQWAWTTSAHRILVGALANDMIINTAPNTNGPPTTSEIIGSTLSTFGNNMLTGVKTVADVGREMKFCRSGMVFEASLGGAAAAFNAVMGTLADNPEDFKKRYGWGDHARDVVGAAGAIIPGVSDLLGWLDGRQDVWIGLLTHFGRPYQAGLTGSTGIVIGQAKSITGFDIIDFFITNKPKLTWNEVVGQIGMGTAQWDSFITNRNFVLGDILSTMLADQGRGVFETPEAGWQVMEIVTTEEVHDGDTLYFNYNGSRQGIRFAGINAPELNTALGPVARDFVRDLIPIGTTLQIKSYPWFGKNDPRNDPASQDSYGRMVAWVYIKETGVNVSLAVYAAGLARMTNTDLINNPDAPGVTH